MDRTEPSASQASSPGQDSLKEGGKEMCPDGSQSSIALLQNENNLLD